MNAVVQGVVRAGRLVAGVVLTLIGIGAFATSGQAQKQAPDQFQVGDRIAITIDPPVSYSDTAIVREGLLLTLPNMKDISLVGVRRADIQKYLTQQIGKYVREPVVKAVALVRIGVFGAVNRPGYYSIPSDLLFGDILMRASGPSGNADPNRIEVKRDGNVIIDRKGTRAALASSKTVDDLRIAANDVVEVGDKPNRSFMTYVQVVSVLVGLVAVSVSLARNH